MEHIKCLVIGSGFGGAVAACRLGQAGKETIVLDGIGLPADFILKLKALKSKVIYNHAGSPNAAMLFFGRNGNRASNLKNIKSTYLKMINLYTHILFQSPTQAKKLNELRSEKEDITLVLRPSVSMSDIGCVKSNILEIDKSNFNLVIVGSVQERKGQHRLPEIAKLLCNNIPNLKLHIVGPIINLDYKKRIDKLIKKNKLENCIIFHGFKANYLDYMNSSDIILQVSEEEGVSRVLREAMALQKVIVSFRLDGTNDLLVEGEDSLLSDFGDVNAISKNILKIYNDKTLADTLSKNALINFDKKYSRKIYLSNLKKILNNLI